MEPSRADKQLRALVHEIVNQELDRLITDRERRLLALEEVVHWRALEFIQGLAIIRATLVRQGLAKAEELDALEHQAAACLAVEGALAEGPDARVERLRRFEAWLLSIKL